MSDTAQWYYSNDTQKNGPYSRDQIAALAQTGVVRATTLVWTSGMANWAPLSDTPLRSELPAQPPTFATPPLPQPGMAAAGPAPGVGFGEAISRAFQNYVNFSGRASRSEFWYFLLFTTLCNVVAAIIDASLFGVNSDFAPARTLFSLAVLLPSLGLMVRRLHDTNRSAWWLLIAFVPLVGAIVLIVFWCQKSKPAPRA